MLMRMLTTLVVLLLALLGHPSPSEAISYDIWFKYPHPYSKVDPVVYCKEDVATAACRTQMPVFTNTLDSEQTYIPYTYNQFDFCPSVEAAGVYVAAADHVSPPSVAHTEWDDHIRLSAFDIKFGKNEDCKLLCKKEYKMLSHIDLYRMEELRLGLARRYYHHWFADNFPASWCYRDTPSLECFIGFPMGYTTDYRGLPEDPRVTIGNFSKPNAVYLYNHFDFTIIYESAVGKDWAPTSTVDPAGKVDPSVAEKSGRIVAIRVTPRSISHNATGADKCGAELPPLEIPPYYHYGLNLTLKVYYSYSVKFVRGEGEDAQWERRWHRLEASLPGTKAGRITLVLAILLLVVMVIPTVYTLARTFFSHRRFAGLLNYSEPRWKLLANDVFRDPTRPGIFVILVGSGTQYLTCIILSELLSIFMFLTSTTFFILLVLAFVALLGFVGGFTAVRLHKTFGGGGAGSMSWKGVCCWVTALNPVVIVSLMFISRNLLLLYQGSLIALPVGPLGAIFVMGIVYGLCLPSTLAGGHLASKRAPIQFPVRPTVSNARDIPALTVNGTDLARPLSLTWWLVHPASGALMAGVVPFLCFYFVESYPFYDNGGWLITIMSVLIAAMTSLNVTYFYLAREDYRWWWVAFVAAGSGALFYLTHMLLFIFTTLVLDGFMTGALYVTFATLLCLALFLLVGTIGFYVGFAFVWHIYSLTQPSSDMNYAVFHKENNNN